MADLQLINSDLIEKPKSMPNQNVENPSKNVKVKNQQKAIYKAYIFVSNECQMIYISWKVNKNRKWPKCNLIIQNLKKTFSVN